MCLCAALAVDAMVVDLDTDAVHPPESMRSVHLPRAATLALYTRIRGLLSPGVRYSSTAFIPQDHSDLAAFTDPGLSQSQRVQGSLQVHATQSDTLLDLFIKRKYHLSKQLL